MPVNAGLRPLQEVGNPLRGNLPGQHGAADGGVLLRAGEHRRQMQLLRGEAAGDGLGHPAVQAAMGQQTTGQQTSVGQQKTTGESTATGNVNTQTQSGGESVQVTKVGGSGSGGSGGSGSASAATDSVYRADYLMGSGTSAAASNKGRKG